MGLSRNAAGWTIITPKPDSSFSTWAAQFGSGYAGNGTRFIFVAAATSSPAGNDGNAGTLAAPVLTIAHALSLLRGGSPDWCLFRNGDTWTNEVFGDVSGLGGLSNTDRMVFSSYDAGAANDPPIPNPGTGGARPLFNAAHGAFMLTNSFGTQAIMGLKLYAVTRDPSSGSYNPAGVFEFGLGTTNSNPCYNYLIEDCWVSFFTQNIENQSANITGGGAGSNNEVRRCIIDHAYDTSANVSVGLGTAYITPNNLVEENFFDFNGYNPVSPGSSLNHNCYLTANNTQNPADPGYVISDLLFKGNINTNEHWDTQLRCGGYIYNNLLFLGEDGDYANYGLSNPAANNLVDFNVFANVPASNYALNVAGGGNPDGSGGFWNLATAVFTRNLCLQGTAPVNNASGIAHFGVTGTSIVNFVTLTNNIAWKFTSTVLVGDSQILSGYNVVDGTGTNAGASPEPFPDPNRTVGSYYATLPGSTPNATFTGVIAAGVLTISGITGTVAVGDAITWSGQTKADYIEAFAGGAGGNGTYNLASKSGLAPPTVGSGSMSSYRWDQMLPLWYGQSKASWNTAYMAATINDYLRAGFNIGSSATASVSTTQSIQQGHGSYKTRPTKIPVAKGRLRRGEDGVYIPDMRGIIAELTYQPPM